MHLSVEIREVYCWNFLPRPTISSLFHRYSYRKGKPHINKNYNIPAGCKTAPPPLPPLQLKSCTCMQNWVHNIIWSPLAHLTNKSKMWGGRREGTYPSYLLLSDHSDISMPGVYPGDGGRGREGMYASAGVIFPDSPRNSCTVH